MATRKMVDLNYLQLMVQNQWEKLNGTKINYRIQLFNDLNNENCDIGKKKTKSKGSSWLIFERCACLVENIGKLWKTL